MIKPLVFFMAAIAPLIGATCESLASLRLPATSFTDVREELGSKFIPPGEKAPLVGLPDFCRVQATLSPSADSSIKIEIWLPLTAWNGKFQGVGNGGFAGALNYSATNGVVAALRRGYATATTDTGHSGTAADARWALEHPEKVIDFGHRAIHLMTERSKTVVEAFYGKGPARSYFSSCSNGGRQALMEAQRYPGDYDGIIAGAPANNFTTLMASFVWNQQALAKGPIPPDRLASIESAVLKDCEMSDGLKDGVIDNPGSCQPKGMLEALPKEEAEALRKIYSGMPGAAGRPNFDGFPPGAETGPGGWRSWITGPKSAQEAFATNFFRYMVFSDPAFDILKLDTTQKLDTTLNLANGEAKLASTLNATEPRLDKFHDRGGKLILYHGWNDPAIPAPATVRYYKQVQHAMGEKKAAAFSRLYMAPGMQHCSGGPGPNSFGAYGEGNAEMFSALERWVEKGEAPNQIIASGPAFEAKTASERRTRPLCPYPQIAKYRGTGDINSADAFACALPK